MVPGVTALRGLFLILAVAPLAGDRPAAVHHGRDKCGTCDMVIGDPGFAGVLRYAGNEDVTFDDLGCLLAAILESPGEVRDAWIEDRGDGHLFPLQQAFVVQGDGVRTPMRSGIVAFFNAEDARRFAEPLHARVIPLREIAGSFSRR